MKPNTSVIASISTWRMHLTDVIKKPFKVEPNIGFPSSNKGGWLRDTYLGRVQQVRSLPWG